MLTIAIFLLLGFILAWVAQMVSREDVSVGAGIGILVIAYICWKFCSVAVRDQPEPLPDVVPVGVLFGVLTVLLNLIGKLRWKHSLIISAIYTVIITAMTMGVNAALNAK